MDAEQQQALDFLARLAAQPAVAFHEGNVASAVGGILEEQGVGFREDVYGNIIARVSGLQPDCAPLALVAHMDHPGFEIVEANGIQATARTAGGVPAASLVKPTPVLVLLPDGDTISATTGRHQSTTDPADRRA
ncbi:MAG: hypothetical protein QF659_09260, partial [Dehalococcoidia bacterium]|nr:hypothetical protein [Dehalococcoidia bacterium]